MDPRADIRIAAIAAKQFGVFSVAQALTAGLSRAAIHHRVATGRWGRMHRGIYRITGSPPTSDQVVMAGWLAGGPEAAVSHRTAAETLGFPVTRQDVEILVPRSVRRAHRGVVVHQTASLGPADRAVVGPLVATSATRTLIDLAAVLDEDRLVACVDRATSKRLTTPAYLRRRMLAVGRNGHGHFQRLERILDERYREDRAPESPLERSLVDLLARLPGDPPVLQFEVRLPDGRIVRLDVAWPDELLAIEADSYEFHSTKTAWSLDATKRVVLVAMGWRILPFTDFDITERPEWLLEQVALARATRAS